MSSSYRDYVSDDLFHDRYSEYQQRYLEEPKESDKVLISMIAEIVRGKEAHSSLLDIGCSSGNLLRHIRKAIPGLRCAGADMAEGVVQACTTDEALEGITFRVMDMLDLKGEDQFDIIVANAVTYLFEDDEYEQALSSIHNALKLGGWYLSFEWIHPFQQDIKIIERSASHPAGIPIHARSESSVRGFCSQSHFQQISVTPFEIPIDLDIEHNRHSNRADGFESLNTYTLKTDTGKRLLFRGALHQPWSFLKAQKAS